MYEITVFTPTYNRAYIIKNVYDSLARQTFKNFEWLVVDDGSIDNTEDLISSFIQENKFSIRYIKKENGGQHTALNLAIQEAHGKMLMIVDSDDYLKDSALERIAYWEGTLNCQKHPKIKWGGVAGLRVYPDGSPIGGAWKHNTDFVDATNLQREKAGLMGDKAEAYYTDVLKQFYPIPVFDGENDVEKAVLWNRIANAGYMIRWFNEGIYVCEYLEDGMSKNIMANHLKNFKGYTCWKKELIDMQKTYHQVIAKTSAFTLVARKKGLSRKEMAKLLNRKPITIFLAEVYLRLHILKVKCQGS